LKTAAVVPIKDLGLAKSRLAGMLSPEQRAALALEMLGHVLDVLRRSEAISAIAVISPDAEGLDLPPGVTRIEQKRTGLNNLLYQGREWTAQLGADALMVVFADLPLLTSEDITAMIRLADRDSTVVLAPDRHEVGTNAMIVRPVSLAHFSFGTRSYSIHSAKYAETGARVIAYKSLGTSLDLDTPDDLAFLESVRGAVNDDGQWAMDDMNALTSTVHRP
jgi:2-phospho-L-lactate guanylyltransferase